MNCTVSFVETCYVMNKCWWWQHYMKKKCSTYENNPAWKVIESCWLEGRIWMSTKFLYIFYKNKNQCWTDVSHVERRKWCVLFWMHICTLEVLTMIALWRFSQRNHNEWNELYDKVTHDWVNVKSLTITMETLLLW